MTKAHLRVGMEVRIRIRVGMGIRIQIRIRIRITRGVHVSVYGNSSAQSVNVAVAAGQNVVDASLFRKTATIA